MTTKEQIDKIHTEEYGDFKGLKLIKHGIAHSVLRLQIGDEKYLEFLKELLIKNPRPKYIPRNY